MNISSDIVIQISQFVFGIAVLIILHELGHFFAGLLFKVEIEEFGIGFPPRMLKLFKIKNILFSLNWLPLGGFVRFKGENDPDVPGGLASAKPLVRLAVLSAGPLTNILAGIILASVVFFNVGEPILDQVQILAISPDSPAEAAGLQVGDLILSVDQENVGGIEDLHNMIYARLGQSIDLVYEREEYIGNVSLIPRDPPPPEDGAVGILMGYPTQPTTWYRAIPFGVTAAYNYTRSVLALPMRLIRGEASPEEGRILGYKGMFDIYQELESPLWFFMIITLSLGLFNLLPIPALDGGRILFTLPELLLRKRVPAKYENMIHLLGFAMLLFLLIYFNIQDFVNPIDLP